MKDRRLLTKWQRRLLSMLYDTRCARALDYAAGPACPGCGL